MTLTYKDTPATLIDKAKAALLCGWDAAAVIYMETAIRRLAR